MAEMHVHAAITQGDMDAAMLFIRKRAKRHDDILEGVTAALFSVMFATADGLLDCGLPVSEIERMFDQFKAQVAFQLRAKAEA